MARIVIAADSRLSALNLAAQVWQAGWMALSDEDLHAIKLLIVEATSRLATSTELAEFKEEMGEFRNETAANFDELFKRDQDRQQEYLMMKERIERLEKKCA